MVAPGFVLAAPKSGSGKTTISTGLLRVLSEQMTVAPFKVGPDYIDPGYHLLAAGRASRNLDPFLLGGADTVRSLYHTGAEDADIAVVEGVMGLFDGRFDPHGDVLCPEGSTADVARQLGLPVVLVVDTRGTAQSIGALVRGFATAHPQVRVAGVIFNRLASAKHEAMLTQAVQAVGVPVVGAVPSFPAIELPSRHLGLVTAVEQGQTAEAAIAAMADHVRTHVDVSALIALAQPPTVNTTPFAPLVGVARAHDLLRGNAPIPGDAAAHPDGPTVAVAAGPAFSFLYTEHLELLAAFGATTVLFDPLHDPLPEASALVIPGGFPELYAETLAARDDVRRDIHRLIADGGVVYGECAGLLWLGRSLDSHRMLDVVPTDAVMGARLTLGYRQATALTPSPLTAEGMRVCGHEFHHTKLVSTPEEQWSPMWGWRDNDDVPMREGFVRGKVMASYLHLHPAAMVDQWRQLVATLA
ncbi:cobyrinate a,c-diamide synthase [Corynebacterium choanae]|uniref:Hydrogenobyrinate a,c-diamide synthase n=1 Tax=Corynebacterium choanae TaxID=1862358 RepID=A0A3G6J7T0_9CORY|nr:cobyrinate a,c-diamide synthase [Corynebacterium choanae]AZA13833.1 Cobyrinic acid A,C-diamide synthase [Corynebacterium choanae]